MLLKNGWRPLDTVALLGHATGYVAARFVHKSIQDFLDERYGQGAVSQARQWRDILRPFDVALGVTRGPGRPCTIEPPEGFTA